MTTNATVFGVPSPVPVIRLVNAVTSAWVNVHWAQTRSAVGLLCAAAMSGTDVVAMNAVAMAKAPQAALILVDLVLVMCIHSWKCS
jgi:hypothetical protein